MFTDILILPLYQQEEVGLMDQIIYARNKSIPTKDQVGIKSM